MAAAFLALVALPGALLANGSGGVVLQQDLEEYRIEVRGAPTQPSVGVWHLSVSVLDRDDGSPVAAYVARLTATPPTSQETPQQPAIAVEGVQCPFSAECRDMNIELDRPGEWEMALNISGPLGEETTKFAARVTEAKIDIGAYTLNGLLLILVGLFAVTTRMWWLPPIRRLFGTRGAAKRRKAPK